MFRSHKQTFKHRRPCTLCLRPAQEKSISGPMTKVRAVFAHRCGHPTTASCRRRSELSGAGRRFASAPRDAGPSVGKKCCFRSRVDDPGVSLGQGRCLMIATSAPRPQRPMRSERNTRARSCAWPDRDKDRLIAGPVRDRRPIAGDQLRGFALLCATAVPLSPPPNAAAACCCNCCTRATRAAGDKANHSVPGMVGFPFAACHSRAPAV